MYTTPIFIHFGEKIDIGYKLYTCEWNACGWKHEMTLDIRNAINKCWRLYSPPLKSIIDLVWLIPRGDRESVSWRSLYTQIPQLTLSPYLHLGLVTSNLLSFAMLKSIIFNILLLHSLHLEAFHSFNNTQFGHNYIVDNQCKFTSQIAWKWVHWPIEMSNTSLSILTISPYWKSHLLHVSIAFSSLGS